MPSHTHKNLTQSSRILTHILTYLITHIPPQTKVSPYMHTPAPSYTPRTTTSHTYITTHHHTCSGVHMWQYDGVSFHAKSSRNRSSHTVIIVFTLCFWYHKFTNCPSSPARSPHSLKGLFSTTWPMRLISGRWKSIVSSFFSSPFIYSLPHLLPPNLFRY